MHTHKKIRVFFGLALSKDDAMRLKHYLVPQKKTALRDAHWSRIDGFHVTTHFLGNIEHTQVQHLMPLAEDLSRTVSPFSFDLTKIARFPNEHAKHVVATVDENPALQQLYDRLQPMIESIGLSTETRPYRPHVTICRCKQMHGVFEPVILDDFRVEAKALVLYQSESIDHEGVYTPLGEFGFCG